MALFYVLVAILPLTQHPLLGMVIGEFGQMTIFKVMGGGCVLYAAGYLAQRKIMPSYLRTWQARLFLVLYFAAVISHFVNGSWDPNALLAYSSLLLLLFVVVSIIDSQRRMHAALLAAVVSIAIASLFVIREWVQYHNVYAYFRPGMVTGDANYFAASTLLCLPISFYFFMGDGPRWERWLCGVALLLMIIALTLAASRGGFLGMIACFLYIVGRSRRRIRNLVLLVALAGPLSLLLPNSPLTRVLNPSYGDNMAEEARKISWKAGLHMMQDHPVFGIGLGHFKPSIHRYESPDEYWVYTIAHNTYIEIAAELGTPVLIVFLMILLSTYYTMERVSRRAMRYQCSLLYQAARSIQAGLCGGAVALFFISGEYNRMLWLLVFVSMVLPVLTRRMMSQNRYEEAVSGSSTCAGAVASEPHVSSA